MAISPPSDIVMDVLRAADPKAVEMARARLQGGAPAAASSESFMTEAPARPAPRAEAPDAAAPFRKFEAMVLGTFLQSMLPTEAGEVYGGGYAGEMWKSLLAQQMGEAIAERGGIGLADRILPNHYRDGKQKVALTGASDVALNEQNLLSTALVQQMERDATDGISGGRSGGDKPSS